MLTQRWIVNAEAEALVYGESDAELGRDSGLSEFDVGLRLRYEMRREFAPYIGVQWQRHEEAPGLIRREWIAVSGLRVWF